MRTLHKAPKNDAEEKANSAARKQKGRIRQFFKRNAAKISLLVAGAAGVAGCAKAEDYLPAACIVQAPETAKALSAASPGMEIPLKGGKVLNILSVDDVKGTVTVLISIGPNRSEPKEINSGSVAEVAGVLVSVCGVADGAATISTNPGPNPERRTIRNKRVERMDLPVCREDEDNRQRLTIVRAEVLLDGGWVEKVIAMRAELDSPLHAAKYISKMCSIMIGAQNYRIMEVHQNGNMELLEEVKVDGDLPKNSLNIINTEFGPLYIKITGSTDAGQRTDSMITVTDEHNAELYEGFAPFKRRHITFTSPEGGGALALGMVAADGDEASRMVTVLAGTPAELFIASLPYYRTAEGVLWITGMERDEHGALKSIEVVLERVPFPEGFGAD